MGWLCSMACMPHTWVQLRKWFWCILHITNFLGKSLVTFRRVCERVREWVKVSEREGEWQSESNFFVGKFLRRYIALLIPLQFPDTEEQMSTETWNLLAEYRIDIALELAQCIWCLYGIKLHVCMDNIYINEGESKMYAQPNIDEHTRKTQHIPRTAKETMLIFILARRFYHDFKQKPPKETKDVLSKLYSTFKDPPERGSFP